jgi:hypothetical protein
MERDKETNKKENKTFRPDEETLHNTDPQENMEGPMSSPTRQTGEVFDSDEDKKNADERREERM